MKARIVLTTVLVSAFSANVLAGHERHMDYARVVAVEPVYRVVERRVPQRECWVETVREEMPVHTASSATGTIVGGIVGGAIGHAVGHGRSNKKLGTVVGAALGMSVGNDLSRRHRHSGYTEVSYRDVERCEVRHVTHAEERLLGYDVTYQYQNQRYTTRMDRHPGKRIPVAVNVSPVGY